MKDLRSIVSIVLTLSLFAIGLYGQEPVIDTGMNIHGGVDRETTRKSLTAISSTAPGGLWSSPSTWVGGVVPGVGDDVTISVGSAVVIDADVTVANLTVGPDVSFNSGILTFDPLAARVLTVTGDLTVSGFGLLTAPSAGTVTTHTITVGGNLTNNGILDLSTNSNQAGAGLVFTGASNNTFGGDGSQTNIRTITVNKGTSLTNRLELTVSNFTVQGSAADTAASGYLTLTNGIFKISGTFTGNHRTFNSASYAIPATAGFWLNNPNYTVAAQTGDAIVSGALQISAGVYNVGTAATDALRIAPTGPATGGLITVDGGSLNVSGAMRRGEVLNVSYKQYGGTTTTCIAGNFAPCFDLSSNGFGGTLIIQTPAAVPNEAVPDFSGTFLWGTMLTFGNAATPGTGVFTASPFGWFGAAEYSLAIDTTAGPHTVKVIGGGTVTITNLNIGPGGTLDTGNNDVRLTGSTFINNGIFKVRPETRIDVALTSLIPPEFTFSGSGAFSGPIGRLYVDRRNVILSAGFSNIRTRELYLTGATVTNAHRLTIGLNDNIASTVTLSAGGTIDSPPTFDLGTGGQNLVYSFIQGTRNTGPEINPGRELVGLTMSNSSNSVLNITGGDLTLKGLTISNSNSINPVLNMTDGDITLNGTLDFTGEIKTGSHRLRHLSGTVIRQGFPAFVTGTMVRRFTATGEDYSFPVGEFQYVPVKVTATSLPSGPAEVAVTARLGVLPGLDPMISVPFRWDIEQMGSMISRLDLTYPSGHGGGNEATFRAWRSSGGTPVVVPSTVSTSTDTVTAQGLSNLTDSWGISERPATFPVNISGTVTTSNGVGIRNAVVRISGGNLPAPITFVTGTFGTYQFQNIESGGEYTVFVSAKRNRFTPPSQIVVPSANITNLNFAANPPE